MSIGNVLMLIGIILVGLIIFSVIRRAVKVAILAGILAIVLLVTGGMLENISKDYKLNLSDKHISFSINGDTKSIGISDIKNIEIKKDKGNTELKVNMKGTEYYEVIEVPSIVYNSLVSGVIKRSKIPIVKK